MYILGLDVSTSKIGYSIIDYNKLGIFKNKCNNNLIIDIKTIYWYSHWKESLYRWKTIYYKKKNIIC